MEHAKRLASVDPRLVESLLTQQQQPTTTRTHALTRLNADMKTIFVRTDGKVGKVLLYNQLLDRYNTMNEQRRQQPQRVSMANLSGDAATALPLSAADPSSVGVV